MPTSNSPRAPGLTRRSALRTLGASLSCASMLSPLGASAAQPYPARPITVVIQYPVGGPSDTLARILVTRMQALLGQPLIVEAKVGAGGNVGTDYVAKAKPDGYTLLLSASGPLAISPWLYRTLPYKPLEDLVPVVQVASVPLILQVNKSSPWLQARDLLEALRSSPGKLNYGSSGSGTPQHLSSVLLETLAQVKANHVPYKGQAPMATDLMGGQIDFAIDSMVSALPNLTSGRLRPLAVTARQRSALLPEVPTLAEAGVPGYESLAWYGLLAPAGTPRGIVERLNQAARTVLDAPEVREQIARLGSESVHGSPEAFGAFIRSEHAKWGPIVQNTGASVN